MDNPFKRIRRAIFGSSRAKRPIPPEKVKGGGFFGQIVSPTEFVGFSLAGHLALLHSRAPKLPGTMDSSDGEGFDKLAYTAANEAIPESLVGWYASHRFLGFQACALIAQHWLINKACSVPVSDALRHGFDIVSDMGEISADDKRTLTRSLHEHEVNRALYRYLRKGRIFGLMIAIFQVDSDDPNYYRDPFNPDAVKPGTYKGIALVEPYWCAPQLDGEDVKNPASPDFYDPTWWRINGRVYHRSHLAVFRMDEVPDILKPSYFYGGLSVPQKILTRVYAAERTADEAPALAMSKRTTVLKTDSEKALANLDNFMAKLSQWIALRDNFGVKVIDKESEDLNQIDTSLTHFDEVMMGQYQLVAAAADVPATKLLGTTPKGFNATGEYEEASYHETLESLQEEHGTPFLERHLLLAALSHGMPGDRSLSVAWKPVDSPTAREYADIRKTLIDHDVAAVEAGIITPEQALARLYADENSGFSKEEGAPAAKSIAELEAMFSELETQAAALTSTTPDLAPTENSGLPTVQTQKPIDSSGEKTVPESGGDLKGLFDELSRMAGTMDAGEKWITVNGAAVPVDEDGKLQGKVGEKIAGAKPRGSARDNPPVASLTGNELGIRKGESVRDAAKRYYEKELMGHPAHREGFGEVKFHKGSGWSKLKNTSLSDDEQLKLLPAVKSVIEKGEYLGAVSPDNREGKKAHIAAYHYFEANVGLGGKNKYVGVTVIEDRQGNKFYNLVKDPDLVHERKRKAAQGAHDSQGGAGAAWDAADSADDILNISIDQDA